MLQFNRAPARGFALDLAIAIAAVATLNAATSAAETGHQRVRLVEPRPGVVHDVKTARLAGNAVINFGQLSHELETSGPPKQAARVLIWPELEDPDEPLSTLSPTGVESPSNSLVASPAPTSSFMGLDDIPMVDSSYVVIPPDVGGAVGPTRVMDGHNNNYRVFNKSDGSVVSTVGVATFWAPSGETALNGLTDPRTIYDPYNNRWIAVMQTVTSRAGHILVGVSQTSDPNGSWFLYRFAAGATIDFPTVGFNKNWIVISINGYSNAGLFQHGLTLIVNYPMARAGTGSGVLVTQASGTHFCSAPCVTYSSTTDTLYLVTHLSSAGATYALDRITGTAAAPVYTAGGTLTRPGGGWAQPGGNQLPQSPPIAGTTACGGSPCLIEAQDAQLRSDPVFRNGFIYYAQTIGLPAAALTHTSVQWTKLSTPAGAFVDGGRIDDPTATDTNGGKWYAFTHIAVNATGDFLVGYSQFSSAQHPGSGYSVHLGTDAAGTIRDPVVYKPGEDYYHKDFGSGRNRWGDFSTAQVDPADDQTIWTLQEYAKARVNTDDGTTGANGSRWSTYWASVGGVIPIASIAPGPSSTEGNSGTKAFNFTVNLSAAATQQVTVNYQTSDGTATVANNDYQAATSSIVIPIGSASGIITVNVLGDTTVEPNETFNVTLTGATNATLGPPVGSTGTILNDDTYTITATAGANGSISPSGAVSVPPGGNQAFAISADAGYHIADVLVNGASVGAVSAYTFTNVTASATIAASFALDPVPSAANIPYSGISPGGVDMATGEFCVQYREPDYDFQATVGPMPVEFHRYYGSMLAQEGLASGHLGPNWLGSYDWTLSVVGSGATFVTNRGAAIRFTQGSGGVWNLASPTYAKFRLDVLSGGTWRVTNPLDRRLYFFDGTTWLLTQILDEHANALNLTYAGGLLSQVSDGLGRSLSFTYDASNHVTQVGDGTRFTHYAYAGGLLTGFTDAAGNSWTYGYVSPGPIQGLLTGVTEPLGNSPWTQAYDPSGRVTSQTDAQGHAMIYTYGAPAGNVVTDGLGNPWTYRHDAQDRLMTLTDPASEPTSFAYDALGRVSMVMRPMGDMTNYAYDPASGYTSMITFADGLPINWGYGSHLVGGATLFDLSTASYPDGTNENYGRDAAGNLTDFLDRGGLHWTGTYNTRGQPLTATNPAGGVTTFTYDPEGRPATERDNAGNTTTYSYDALSRLTQVLWPDASHRNFGYDNLDRTASLTDERSKLWTSVYDTDGRLMTETDPLFEATGFLYDALDRVTQAIDPLGHATGYAYDPAGRLASMTDRSGRTTGYQYDTVGRLTGIADPAGGTAIYSYDSDSRVPAVQDALGHSTGFAYDFLDQVTHMTDPVGTGFDYGYDPMGRLLTANAPLGRTEHFGYDARGLMTSFFDATSETDLPRTALGELQQFTDPNRNAWPRTYDPQGRTTSIADPLGRAWNYEYDLLSRPIHIGRSDGSVQQISYDPSGRTMGESYSDGTSFSYSYDDANRLTGATGASFSYDAAGRMTSSNGFAMTYDNEGRIASETFAPGKVVTYSYDTRGLPSQMTDWLGGTTTFGYDAAQRLTGIARPNGTSVTYQYDAADRLMNEVEKNPGPIQDPPLASIAITRDALGQVTGINRIQPLMPGETAPASSGFTYDAASLLSGVTHDALGRTTGDASRVFQWDGASRLTHYAAGADSPRFTYDAFGSLLTQTQGAQTVRLAWNYWRDVPDVDDMQVSLPVPKTSYLVRAPSGLLLYAIDGTTGARSFYHYDENGNTSFLTNDSASVVAAYAYTPLGGVTGLGQTANNPFTFDAAKGAVQLGSSGLFQEGGGVHDPTTGALLSDEIEPDRLARLKVQFHWDRQGKENTPSRCWIRVSSMGCGNDRGTVADSPYRFGQTIVDVDDMPVPLPPRRHAEAAMMGAMGDDFGVLKSDANHLGSSSLGGGYGSLKVPSRPNRGSVLEVGDFSTDLEDPMTIGSAGSGGGEGKRTFDEIPIQKPTDHSDLSRRLLYLNCVLGVHFPKSNLKVRHADDSHKWLRLAHRPWIPPWEE